MSYGYSYSYLYTTEGLKMKSTLTYIKNYSRFYWKIYQISATVPIPNWLYTFADYIFYTLLDFIIKHLDYIILLIISSIFIFVCLSHYPLLVNMSYIFNCMTILTFSLIGLLYINCIDYDFKNKHYSLYILLNCFLLLILIIVFILLLQYLAVLYNILSSIIKMTGNDGESSGNENYGGDGNSGGGNSGGGNNGGGCNNGRDPYNGFSNDGVDDNKGKDNNSGNEVDDFKFSDFINEEYLETRENTAEQEQEIQLDVEKYIQGLRNLKASSSPMSIGERDVMGEMLIEKERERERQKKRKKM